MYGFRARHASGTQARGGGLADLTGDFDGVAPGARNGPVRCEHVKNVRGGLQSRVAPSLQETSGRERGKQKNHRGDDWDDRRNENDRRLRSP